MKTAFLIIVTFISILSVKASVKDSVGVEKKGDKYFVQHKMESGETLYALSKKYNVTVDQIKSANTGVNINDISIGQIILIPSNYSPKAASPAANANKPASGSKKHIVEAKETLYSLTKKYNISAEELKKANPQIAELGLQVGMELTIPGTGASATAPNAVATPKPATTKTTPAASKPAAEQPKPVASKPKPVVTERQTAPAEIATKNSKVEKVNEKGQAELVPGRQDAPDFFAYHKTAPVGTIILVFNEENNQKAYVRVIGPLKSGYADNTLIQLSPKAMERIKAEKDAKVTLSYFMP